MDAPALKWLHNNIHPDEIEDASVLEVGSQDVNGSIRPYVTRQFPSLYHGVDMAPGRGVDEVADVHTLIERFGRESWDVVISTEMLEHVQNWKGAVIQLKEILRPGGTLLLTTRAPGFPRHGYPDDYWRFTPHILQTAFSDFDILQCNYLLGCGVAIKARKPLHRRPEYYPSAIATPIRHLGPLSQALWFKLIYAGTNPDASKV